MVKGGIIMKLNNMTEKENNIYNNLEMQVNAVFKHSHECAFKTRDRYRDAMLSFSKFLAVEYKKQNITKIKNKHIEEYVLHMQKQGYSTSYVTTNLSAIRYYYDKTSKGKFIIKNNRELGVNSRKRDERIGDDKSITDKEFNNLLNKAKEIGREDFILELTTAEQFGLRIHEVFSLRHSQIREALKKGELRIKGKGGLIRYLPTNDKREILEKLDNYKKTDIDSIFVDKNEKTHLKIKEMQCFIKNTRGDNDDYTFHSIRHSYAQKFYVDLISKGITDYEARLIVAKRLGHNRVSVSSIYLDSVDD